MSTRNPTRLLPTEIAAGLGLGSALTLLCAQRGGVDAPIYAPAFGLIIAFTAVVFALSNRFKTEVAIPWPVAVIALLPFVQLVPLADARLWLWPAWRQDLSRVFAGLGVDAPSTTSIYPYATLRAAVVLAGCCALFVLARAAARWSRGAIVVLAAIVLTLAVAESSLGLLQAFANFPALTTAGASAVARGTFANRNHFAVLLEAGFCIALGLGVVAGRIESPGRPAARRQLSGWSCKLGAALCLAGIAASGSRMGILIAFATALSVPVLLFPRPKRSALLPFNFAALILVAALSFPKSGKGFQTLFSDKGDPGRLAIWSDSLPAAARHWATGSGLGTFAFAFQRSHVYFPRNTIDHAHSDWLEFLVELGLPGALFVGISIAGVFARCLRPTKRPAHPPDPLQTAFLLGAGAILLHASVDFPLKIPALAAVFAVLLGSASGLAHREEGSAPPSPATRALSAIGCCAFVILAAAVASGQPASWNADSLFAAGQRQFLTGQTSEASRSFQMALEANPFAASAWQQRGEAGRASSRRDSAHEHLELASQLEPFTFRTEWPAAQSLLRSRRWEQAAARLSLLAEAIPDVRPAIVHAAFEAGMPAVWIKSIVPAGATGVWLRALADRGEWGDFRQSLSGGSGTAIEASVEDCRYLLDTLFQRRQHGLMKELWTALGREATADSLVRSPDESQFRKSDSTGSESSAPDAVFDALPVNNAKAESLPIPDRLDSSFGFEWVARPVHNVRLRTHSPLTSSNHIELDFREAVAPESVHLSRYVAVAPATDYVVETQLWTEAFMGGEVRLEIWSTSRLLGSSFPARNSSSRQFEVPFRSGDSDEVLQLRVVSRPSREHKAIRGRFFLGPFQLRSTQPEHHRGNEKTVTPIAAGDLSSSRKGG